MLMIHNTGFITYQGCASGQIRKQQNGFWTYISYEGEVEFFNTRDEAVLFVCSIYLR